MKFIIVKVEVGRRILENFKNYTIMFCKKKEQLTVNEYR